MEKGGFEFIGSPQSNSYSYTYKNKNNDKIVLTWTKEGIKYDVFDMKYEVWHDFNPSEFTDHLEKKYGMMHPKSSIKNNIEACNALIKELNNFNVFVPGTTQVKDDHKILAIKTLRAFFGGASLFNAKYIIENFDLFIEYSRFNGFPPVGDKDITLDILKQWKWKTTSNGNPKSNNDIVNELVDLMKDAGILGENKTINPENKIQAIKILRTHTGCGLAYGKIAVENFPAFLLYIKENGLPPGTKNTTDLFNLLQDYMPPDAENEQHFPNAFTYKQFKEILSTLHHFEGSGLWAGQYGAVPAKSYYELISIYSEKGKELFVLIKKDSIYKLYESTDSGLLLKSQFIQFSGLLKDLTDILVNYVSNNKQKEESKSISISDTYSDVLVAGGFVELLEVGGYEYVHASGFIFKVWPTKVEWQIPGQLKKEFALNQDTFGKFFKLLDFISPALDANQLDYRFSKQTEFLKEPDLEESIKTPKKIQYLELMKYMI